MAMRESVTSLRIFFALVGWVGLANGNRLLDPTTPGVLKVLALIGFIGACCCFYIAVSAKRLLANSPGFIIGVILVMLGFSTLRLLDVIIAKQYDGLVAPLLALLVCLYLILNTRRLAREQTPGVPSP